MLVLRLYDTSDPRQAPVSAYHELLLAEIALTADALPGRIPGRHIHFGDGSPNMLAPDEIAATLELLRRHFAVLDDAEIAIEIDPQTTAEAFIDACAYAGVTRLSLGVQDLNAAVQKAVNRVQSFETLTQVTEHARQQGIADIDIDLMYGLPHQTTANVARTIKRALTLDPTRIALFGYTHVPWMKPHMRLIDDAALPDAEDRWQQAETAREQLIARGYLSVGMDHFARPGTALADAAATRSLRRNIQGYTTDPATSLLPFGSSAIGQLPQGYVQNKVYIRRWTATIDAGIFAIAKGLRTTDDDRMRRDIIERLMCDMAVDAGAVAERRGFKAADPEDSFVPLGHYDEP